MKAAHLFCVFAIISGCSKSVYEPVDIPSSTPILNYIENTIGYTDSVGAEEYLSGGFSYVKTNCERFFNEIEQVNQDAEFAQETLVNASTGLVALLQLASVGDLTTASIQAGVALAQKMLISVRKIYGFNELRHFIYPKIRTIQAAKENDARLALRESRIKNIIDAHKVIADYATVCMPASIWVIAKQSAAAGKVAVSGTRAEDVGIESSGRLLGPDYNGIYTYEIQ